MSVPAPVATPIATAEEAEAATHQIATLRKRAKAFAGLGLPDDADAAAAEADAIADALRGYEAAQHRQHGTEAFAEMRAIVAEARALEEQFVAGLVALVGIAADLRRAGARFQALRPVAARGGRPIADLDPVRPKDPFGLIADPLLHEDPALALGLHWNDPAAHAELARRRAQPPGTTNEAFTASGMMAAQHAVDRAFGIGPVGGVVPDRRR